jgi:signal transduction histidine kinase
LWTLEDFERLSGTRAQGGAADLESLGGAACFPIDKEGELMGLVILGPKRSGEPFNSHDVRIIRALRRRLESFLTQAMVLTHEALNMVKDSHGMKNEVNALKGRASWRAMRVAAWWADFEKEMSRLEKWLAEAKPRLPASDRDTLATALQVLRQRSVDFCEDAQRSIPIEENAIARLTHHLKNWAEFGRVVAEGFRGRRSHEVVDVGQAAHLAVDRWKPMAEKKNLKLSADVSESLFIEGERSLLEQIIENLIDNAVQATREGFVQVVCRKQQNEIRIDVRDSGCGIAPQELTAIFDKPFYQGRSRRKMEPSTGVGLYLVAEYAKSLGGRASVESHVGKGSTFHVILPAHSKERKPAEVAA